LIFFVAAFIFWLATTPVCTKILAACSYQAISALGDYGITQDIMTQGKTIAVKYAPSLDGKPHLINARNISFNTVFLLALIMAVPDVRYKLRLKILLLGVIFLFPIQVLRLSIYVLNFYGLHIKKAGVPIYSDLWRKILFFGDLTLTRLDTMLAPVVIWAGLFFYYDWHKKFRREIARQDRGVVAKPPL